jgi:hypothetical protein
MTSPITLVNITSTIQTTALSIPRALASRATHTSRAMLRRKNTIGQARFIASCRHAQQELIHHPLRQWIPIPEFFERGQRPAPLRRSGPAARYARPLPVAPRLRGGISIESQPIAQGETVERTADWWPPTDVYVLSWEPTIGARGSGAELFLMAGDARVFGWQDGERHDVTLSTRETPAGTGYLVRRGEAVKLWLRMTNTGPAGETHASRAFLYFEPVEGS